ncbi:hypothetical protein BLNAU_5899 [Blattamonas nauphoetae]|uniref:Ubiquitin-like domain-containing protein n=1 Tax=Blattamonas nauphoetae TaxID=2049346 RepID=A0ABQ9Y5X7_9EUKA|nr:hypothetical protein BLNAU_5899 [Blattamonas nauphoetae]
MIPEPFTLLIKSATTGDQFTLNCYHGQTIQQIKQALVPSVNVPVQDMSLMHEADNLPDHFTLSQINFNGHYALILFLTETDTSADAIQITVRDEKNQSFPVTISPSKTIGELKAAISNVTHAQTSAIRLVFNGSTLADNNKRIGECGIMAQSAVDYVANIIGGV